MNVNDIERKKALAGEMSKAVCNLANIVEDWNDAQEEAATLQYLREARDKFRQRAEER